MAKKKYLGDGVFIQPGHFQGETILTTEDGISITNTIVLEPGVAWELQQYLEALAEELRNPGMKTPRWTCRGCDLTFDSPGMCMLCGVPLT